MTDITDRLDRIEASLKRRELIYDAREQVGWLEIEQLNSLFAYLKTLMSDAAPSPKEKLAEPTYTSIDFLVYDADAYRGFPLILRVNHRMIDGMHFFTSGDYLANGLLVCSADLREAFDDVSLQLERLLAFNFKQHVKFVPLVSFEEFESRLAKEKE